MRVRARLAWQALDVLRVPSHPSCCCTPPAPLPPGPDCNGDLSGLSLAERDSLRDWQARLYSKYPIVGDLVGQDEQAAAAAAPAKQA